jgi:hypothetical protein
MLPEEFNYNSREWGMIRTALEKRLETAVGQLCNTTCEPKEADQLRGRISLIKDILASERSTLMHRLAKEGT